MIAPVPCRAETATEFRHAQFPETLPSIRHNASYAFRRLNREAREDAVQEVAANAYIAFAPLVQRGKADIAFPGVLARYGVAQFHAGRRVGTKWNTRDVFAVAAQRKGRFRVERLDQGVPQETAWREAVLEDRRTPVADQAAFRCDFPEWLKTLSSRDRQIADALLRGEQAGMSPTDSRFATAGSAKFANSSSRHGLRFTESWNLHVARLPYRRDTIGPESRVSMPLSRSVRRQQS